MRKSLLILTLASLAAPAAFASDTHSGHDMQTHDGMMGDGIQAEATVNSIEGDIVNVTHGPIAEIGWPAMTMDLTLLDGAEIDGVEVGDDAMMLLEKGPDGMFAVRSLMPME